MQETPSEEPAQIEDEIQEEKNEKEEEEEEVSSAKQEKPIGPIFNPWINYMSAEETKRIKKK